MGATTAVLRWDGQDRAVYRAGHAPDELATRGQLRSEGLSIAGLEPAAWLHYSPLHGICPLYDRSQARPVRPLTARQHATLADGRRRAHSAICGDCGVLMDWHPTWGRREQAVCEDCSGKRIRARLAAEAAEHRRMLAADRAVASAWARGVLADPDMVILDSETTGLDGYAVQIAVLSAAGDVLLDTLLHPQEPIPSEATAIHGITDTDVTDAPTFAAIVDRLAAVLHNKRVVVYNAAFDAAVLRRELERYHRVTRPMLTGLSPWEDHPNTKAWLRPIRWDCAMERYAEWWGDWHSYWGNYTWQPLNGGHNALSDCRTTLQRLHEMRESDTGSHEHEKAMSSHASNEGL